MGLCRFAECRLTWQAFGTRGEVGSVRSGDGSQGACAYAMASLALRILGR